MAHRSTTRTSPRSSSSSPRPIEECEGEPRATRRTGPRQTRKSLKCAAISNVSGEIRCLFELPSLPQPSYLACRNVPVCGDRLFAFYYLLHPRRRRMAKGTVKWFNPTKGYG